MVGHNSLAVGTATQQLAATIGGLGLAIRDERTHVHDLREDMILVARWLTAVDAACGNNMALANQRIREAGVLLPTDRIFGEKERDFARWFARGGVNLPKVDKNLNEIKDLASEVMNPVENRLLTHKRYAKLTTYGSVYGAFRREALVEIRDALDGVEGKPDLPTVLETYADIFFEAETIGKWVADEQYKRTDEYVRKQNLKAAMAMVLDDSVNSASELERLEDIYKDELAKIHKLAAEKRQESEQKANLAKLTTTQRQLLIDNAKRLDEAGGLGEGMSDKDF